jgi:hypothetical protein
MGISPCWQVWCKPRETWGLARLPNHIFTLHYKCLLKRFRLGHIKVGGPLLTASMIFVTDSGWRDRALLVLGSNTANQATSTALLDPSTHFRPLLTRY